MSHEWHYDWTFSSSAPEGTPTTEADWIGMKPTWIDDDMNDSSRTGTHYYRTPEGFARHVAYFYRPGPEKTEAYDRGIKWAIEARDEKDPSQFEWLKRAGSTRAIDAFLKNREAFERKYPSAKRLAAGFKRAR